MRIPGSLAPFLVVGLVVALPVSCARQPRIDVDQLVCATNENCPVGRQCSQGHCVVPGSSRGDAAADLQEATGPASADADVDTKHPSVDTDLSNQPPDSGADVPMSGAGGATGRDGSGVGDTTDASAGSGTGGIGVGAGGIGATGGIGGAGGSGPMDAAGGAAGSGGMILVGGSLGSGGNISTGGFHSTGGVLATGGVTGTGGVSSTGGVVSSGGVTGTGGVPSTGGVVGSGGVIGSGGVVGTGGTPSTGGAIGTGGTQARPLGPCDIYAAASPATPCAAAYSMTRALSSTYSGPLYQVRSGSSSTNTGTGGAIMDIGMLADGYADSATQDSFCGGSTCTVSILYDQSGNGNDLARGSAGPSGNGARSGSDDYESTATKLSVTVGGHKVYALYMAQYEGYRTPLGVVGKGMPVGNKDRGSTSWQTVHTTVPRAVGTSAMCPPIPINT